MKTAKLAGSAVVASALLLGSAGLAFAQTNTTTGIGTTASTSGTSSMTGTTATTSTGTTGTAGTTGTTGTSGMTSTSSTPGTPNTGAGGDATANALMLAVSALAVVFGGTFLARKAALR